MYVIDQKFPSPCKMEILDHHTSQTYCITDAFCFRIYEKLTCMHQSIIHYTHLQCHQQIPLQNIDLYIEKSTLQR